VGGEGNFPVGAELRAVLFSRERRGKKNDELHASQREGGSETGTTMVVSFQGKKERRVFSSGNPPFKEESADPTLVRDPAGEKWYLNSKKRGGERSGAPYLRKGAWTSFGMQWEKL